jgi:hypothetical protein
MQGFMHWQWKVMCKIKHLLLEIFRWNLVVGCYCCWWVVACSWLALLLLVQLLALVLLLLNDCLSFSSWDCCLLLALLLLGSILSFRFYSMVLLGDVLMCLWCCERTMVFLWWWSIGRVCAVLPGRAHLLQLLESLPCCGVDTTTLSQCDWAACKQLSCLSLTAWSDPLLSPVTLWLLKCWVHQCFVPYL